jgi:hypothetical protein
VTTICLEELQVRDMCWDQVAIEVEVNCPFSKLKEKKKLKKSASVVTSQKFVSSALLYTQ